MTILYIRYLIQSELQPMREENQVYQYQRSILILRIFVILYLSSITIFAKLDNVFIGNIIFVIFALYYLMHQFLFEIKLFYISRELVFYLLFMIFSFLSFFWSIEPVYTQIISIRILFIFLSLLIIFDIAKKYEILDIFFAALCIITVINVMLFLKLIPWNIETYFPSTNRFMGTTENPNILSSAMFVSIFISTIYIHKHKKRTLLFIGYLNVILSYFLILLTLSRTALVVSLGLILLLFVETLQYKDRRKYVYFFTVIMLVISLFFVDFSLLLEKIYAAIDRISYIFEALSGNRVEHSADERIELVAGALQRFSENPIFGTGMDTVKQYLGVYAHNNYAELLANSGLIGCCIYYLIYFSTLLKAFDVKDRWIRYYILIFVFSLFAYDLGAVSYYDKLKLITIIFAGFYASKYSKNVKNSH